MKATRLLLAVAALLMVATAAHAAAGYARLSWDNCAPQVPIKLWQGPTGIYKLVVSVRGLDIPTQGHDFRITVGPYLPDAWRFDDAGCNVGMATFSRTMGKTCPSLVGTNPLGLEFYRYDPDTQWGEIQAAIAFDEVICDPATRYVLCTINFDHTYSVVGVDGDAGTCDNVQQILGFTLHDLYFLQSDGQYIYPGPEPTDSQVYWNNQGTAAKAATWGRVKGMYR